MGYILRSAKAFLLVSFLVLTSEKYFVAAGEGDQSCANNETSSTEIPIIDISALRGGNKAEKYALSKRIGQACRDIG